MQLCTMILASSLTTAPALARNCLELFPFLSDGGAARRSAAPKFSVRTWEDMSAEARTWELEFLALATTTTSLEESARGKSDEASDVELMERFQNGDEAAFDALFTRHSPVVYAFIFRMVRNEALASDLLQVTFLSVVRSRLRYAKGTPVGPWLFTIAANAARDALRRRKNAEALVDETSRMPPGVVDPVVPDVGLRRKLTAAMDQLTPEQREAVILHKIEGWSFQQIAEHAGVTETAARIRAHRGYEKLKSLLEEVLEAS